MIFLCFSYLDYVSIMTYDYHGNLMNRFEIFENMFFWSIGAWDNVTGMNAPLYGGGGDKGWSVVGCDERSENEMI